MYKCSICGKFRKWTQLRVIVVPDTHFTTEDVIIVCIKCQEGEI